MDMALCGMAFVIAMFFSAAGSTSGGVDIRPFPKKLGDERANR